MANTYAINTVRGAEFEVEAELRRMGATPWVPRRLESKKIKQQKERVWFDVAYVPKLVFAVFPAVIWPDVVGIKEIIGKPYPLANKDITGTPAFDIQCRDGTTKHVPRIYGLQDFKDAVLSEYTEMERSRANNLFQCTYTAGQALEVLSGPFQGMPAEFKKTLKHAYEDYARLQVDVTFSGGTVKLELDPNDVAAM